MPAAVVAFAFPSLVGTVAGSVLTAVVSVGLSIGASLVAGLLQSGPKSPKPEDIQTVVRQSVNKRVRCYGWRRLGGAIVFIETYNGALFQIIVHCDGPVQGFGQTYIDNRLVSLTGVSEGGVTTAPYSSDRQFVRSRYGAASQPAIGEISGQFPAIWSAVHQLNGICYSMLQANSVDQEDINKVYPNRIPVLNRVIQGALVYDPRDAATRWTRNPALILRDYLTHPDGMRLPASLVDDNLIALAANVCDEAVTTKEGTSIPRYGIGLSYEFEEDPVDVLNRIIVASDGRLFLTGEGKIGFQAGAWIAPTVAFTADNILTYDLSDGAGPFREANEVIVKYTVPDVEWKEGTSDPWRDEAAISELGEVRSQSVAAYEIEHHNHARRIAKIVQARAMPRWQGTIVTNLYGLNAWDQRWVTIQIPDEEIDATFEIIGPPEIDTRNMRVKFTVQSFSATTYDFDASLEEGTAPAVPETTSEDFLIEPPASVVLDTTLRLVSSVTQTFDDTDTVFSPDGEGGGSNSTSTDSQTVTSQVQVPVIGISWPAPPRAEMRADVEFSVSGSDQWIAVAVSNGATYVESQAVARGTTYVARVRYRTAGGVSSWTLSNVKATPA